MSADSNEFGSNSARSNPRARMSRVIRVQLPRPDGFSWLHTLSTNGADVKRPATHGRTSSVISASGKCSRTTFIAGMASTASPTQLGPRIRIFSISIFAADLQFETACERGGRAHAILNCSRSAFLSTLQPAQNQGHQAVKVANLSRDPQVAERSIRDRPQAHCVLLRRDQHLTAQIFNLTRGIVMMVTEADAFHGMDSNRFKRTEKSFWFCDSRKRHNGPVFERLRLNRCITGIYGFNLSSDREARNG